ncbi:MAG TPA: hypothetical protein VIN09_00965 [Chloroflexota bacterium]
MAWPVEPKAIAEALGLRFHSTTGNWSTYRLDVQGAPTWHAVTFEHVPAYVEVFSRLRGVARPIAGVKVGPVREVRNGQGDASLVLVTDHGTLTLERVGDSLAFYVKDVVEEHVVAEMKREEEAMEEADLGV